MAAPPSSTAGFVPRHLRCEYLENPNSLHEERPRLSWILEATSPAARELRQREYRIQVASTRDQLKSGPYLCDTGKVESDRTTQIEYTGKALVSRQQCFWRVQSWDADEKPSGWSEIASWSMGLLSPADWSAKWIEEPDPLNFERCRWIWHPDEPDARKGARKRTCCFQNVITLPEGSFVAQAALLTAHTGRLTMVVNGVESGESETPAGERPQPITVDVTGALQDGENVISLVLKHPEEGRAAGLTGKLVIRLQDQSQISFLVDENWRVGDAVHGDKQATTAFHSDWPAAKRLIGVGEADLWGPSPVDWAVPGREDDLLLPPVPRFRKPMKLAGRPERATVYVGAIGLYELRVNGTKVGNDRLTPGWPDYFKRAYYNTYDVTSLLHKGENVLAVTLADGWGAGYVGWARCRNRFGFEAALRLQLHLEFPDGNSEVVRTNETWRCSVDGPVREADLLMGETHDARLEQPGWDRAGFDDSTWKPAALPSPPPALPPDAYPSEPVRAHEEIHPVHVAEPESGVYVFDLGQNMVGVARLRATGPRGTVIRIRYAEVLQDNGMLYTESLRGARATDTYIKDTDDDEVWEPLFTFHGFRYVEVTGLPHRPSRDTITGVVLHNEMERAGEFSTSNLLVNQLYHNIVWGQKGNYLEAPTDCPQRDERLGWTGDAQAFIRTGSFNFDLAAFMTKWIRDLFDTQSEEGWFGSVAPHMPFEPLPKATCHAWSDAAIICPWTLYRVYGDTRIIKRFYPEMALYIEHLKSTSDSLIRPPGGYGDWVSLNAETPTEVINTAYFALVTRMMGEMARAIGRIKEAMVYDALFQDIKAAFIKAFVGPDGRVKGNTQTCYVLALRYDLLPDEQRKAAKAHLVQDFAYRSGHFSTGFVGLKDLMPTLSQEGRDDLAYRILLKDTFPSWGYEIKAGATTIWERWDGWTEELGLQTPAMNSFNHYAFGAVGEWLYMTVSGIDLLEPGYRRIRIRPRMGGDLRHARAQFRSPNGWIGSEWYRESGRLRLVVRVPVNTVAEVHVPGTSGATEIREGDKPVSEVEAIRMIRQSEEETVFEVPSGHYVFTTPF